MISATSRMSLKHVVGIVLLSCLLAGCQPASSWLNPDGSPFDTDAIEGHWLAINYWAKWCGPCRAEIPELNELHHELAVHGVFVLGVNYDQLTGAALEADIAELGIEFPVLANDPQTEYGFERATVLPMTVIISPQGVVHQVLVGPQTLKSIIDATSAVSG